MNLAGGECRCCTARPDHTAEPSDRAAGVGQLQRKGVGATGWDVADGKRTCTVDRLSEQVAKRTIDVQCCDSCDVASVATVDVRLTGEGRTC